MPPFCEDDRRFVQYLDINFDEIREPNTPFFECMQWDDRHTTVQASQISTDMHSFIERTKQPETALRVVFLPFRPAKHDVAEIHFFESIIEPFSIPSAVFAERVQFAGYSFGSATLDERNTEIAWCQFVSRNVEVEDGLIRDLEYRNDNKITQAVSRISLWTNCDFYLHIRRKSTQPKEREKAVTLFCFGAPNTVRERFCRLHRSRGRIWPEIVETPYLLFDVLFDELHALIDRSAWNLHGVVALEEEQALKLVFDSEHFDAGMKRSFRNLHNIQKNCFRLIEAVDATMATLEAMAARLREPDNDDLALPVARAIEYRKRMFHSTRLRLNTMESRVTNIIQLSLSMDNEATKAISEAMKADSRAMKLIALLTLLFLPATGIASILSTPFFNVDWETPKHGAKALQTANDFWIFWAIVLPLTSLGLLLYWVYTHQQKLRGWVYSSQKNILLRRSRMSTASELE